MTTTFTDDFTMKGGARHDQFTGGAGRDALSASDASAALGDMTGTPFADTLTGDAGANSISGLGGADTINGGDGDDILYGHSAGATGEIFSTAAITGLAAPVAGAATAADPGFLYLVEKGSGIIWRADVDTGEKTVFLDIPQAEFTRAGERGVLGLAFHPDYASNGRFFVFLTDAGGNPVVREYHRSSDPSVAETAFVQVIGIGGRDPAVTNHNGGWIGFSPVDGYLYISVGDGGGGGDVLNNAQNTSRLLGKILRIDVNGDAFPGSSESNYAIPASNPFVGVAGSDEIWAYGLRNPWRAAFDPRNGDLYIGDVGQEAREEIDRAPQGVGGLNFGWHIMEGTLTFDPEPPPAPQPGDPSLINPIYDYDRTIGTTVTGGEVYVGPTAAFVGQYVFADFGSGRLFTLAVVGGATTPTVDITSRIIGAAPTGVVDFATDANGMLYAIGIGGTVWRLDIRAGAEDVGDILNGGAGNDVIAGGAGADQLLGGPGDDVIFWDAGDNLANVLGGADTDLLVFTSGAPPTSFDLTSHGFEAGEGRFTDTGGNPWATQTLHYSSSWQLDWERIVDDDGSRTDLDYDEASAFFWTTKWADYNPGGQLEIEVLVHDDGVRDTLGYDPADAHDWVTAWVRYDNLDRVDTEAIGYDDGTRVTLDHDQANAFDWTQDWLSYDSLDRVELEVITYDDGSRAVLDLDASDAFDWASMWWLFDSNGNQVAFHGVNDDGTTF